MPNRIIKESICTSDTVDDLSWFEEVFFYRLIVTVDDYGRFDGRPALLKARMFPLKNVTEKQVEDALNKLQSAGIVTTYTVEEKPYLQIVTWENHQTIRNKKSKYPSQDEADPTQTESTCNQLNSIASKCSRNPIQSESNPNPNPNTSTERSCDHSMPNVIEMPLNDGSTYPVSPDELEKWTSLYQAVDVMQELRKMVGWLDANSTKRKTKKGIVRFITGWLARCQDSGGSHSNQQPGRSSRYGRNTNQEQPPQYDYLLQNPDEDVLSQVFGKEDQR